MKTCVFVAVVVVVGISGGRFPDEKACYLSRKTWEKNVCRGRMIGLSTEGSNGGDWRWKLFCDKTGKWPEGPEVLKSRACPVVWPGWRPEVAILGADQKERGLWWPEWPENRTSTCFPPVMRSGLFGFSLILWRSRRRPRCRCLKSLIFLKWRRRQWERHHGSTTWVRNLCTFLTHHLQNSTKWTWITMANFSYLIFGLERYHCMIYTVERKCKFRDFTRGFPWRRRRNC